MWRINAAMMIALIAILGLLFLWIFLIAPSFKRGRAKKWQGTAFAHRGLHGNGVPENSMAAFENAVCAGFGIELDVRLTRDGKLVVFHDDDLKRMTGDERMVEDVDFDALRNLALPDGSQIPTFAQVLQCVNGRVPLLVEIKNGRRNAELCERTMQHLRAYSGAYIVESFNPLILLWLRRNADDVIRGQLVSVKEDYMPAYPCAVAIMIASLGLNLLSRPDFVAYNVSEKSFAAPRIQRKLFKTPLAAWTVKDEDTYEKLISRGEMPIFEGFTPEKNR